MFLLIVLSVSAANAGTKFDACGFIQADGKPFFPIGIYLYELTPDVMKDIKAKHFNTIIGNGFRADQLEYIHANGLMCVPFSSDEFVKAGKDSPAVLAWYLVDEPESGHAPQNVKDAYAHLRAKDPSHPIGLCHYLFDALAQFKDACDFTMTDVYPVTKDRDVPLKNVGIHIDQARAVHGNPDWPHWAYIQDFGGPDTDGGKWAQPIPEEVRCMTYIALVHRVQGILYFSYWPKAPETWNSIGELNAELRQIAPLLMADGQEPKAVSSDVKIEVRARKLEKGWLILAVNTERASVKATVEIVGLADTKLKDIHAQAALGAQKSRLVLSFAPLEAKAFVSDGFSP